MKKIALAYVAILLFCSHDMFLKTDTYFLPPDTPAAIQLFNGTFDKSENSIDRDRMQDVSLVGQGRRNTVSADQWSVKDSITFLNFTTGAPGTWMVGVSTRPREIELSAEDFNEYLEHDGVTDMLDWRKENQALQEDAIERYSKHVKTLFQVGGATTDDWQTELGYPIEFVPLENPYSLHPGHEMRIKLLWQGAPLANQLVYIGSRPALKTDEGQSAGEHTHGDGSSHTHQGEEAHSHVDGGPDHSHADATEHSHSENEEHTHSDGTTHTHDESRPSDEGNSGHSHAGADSEPHGDGEAHSHSGETPHTHDDNAGHTHEEQNHAHDDTAEHSHANGNGAEDMVATKEEDTHVHEEVRQIRTDSDGTFGLSLDTEGVWYLRTIYMTRSESPGLTHESNWATLTFAIGQGHADGHSHDGEAHVHEGEEGIPSFVYWIGSFVLLGALFFWFNRKN